MLSRTFTASTVLLSILATAPAQDPLRAEAGMRQTLERALRSYFAAAIGDGPELREAAQLAKGREDLLLEILRAKSFLPPADATLRRGSIDATHRFVDASGAANPAWIAGPATHGQLLPMVVYVPDVIDTGSFGPSLQRDGAARGWFVLLVPDERRDNQWHPTLHEHRRHTGPLRDLLLQQPIDPDRVSMIGSGRGGHATWDVGLLHADRFAGLVPCNGGLWHEGGFAASGGVFLHNAAGLSIATVYNTSFDHGIESCRYAGRKFQEWGYRFTAVEEEQMRVMGIAEAVGHLAGVVRDAHPRTLVKRFNHVEHGGHFWLTALSRTQEWDPKARIAVRSAWPLQREQQLELVWEQVREACALLQGRIQGNRVDVTAKGIGRLRVWFDPQLLDFGKKVTVAVNGRVLATVVPARKVEVLLQQVWATGDTARLYWDCVDVRVGR